MKKQIFVVFLIFILSLTMAGCSTDGVEDSNSKNLETITIGVMPDLDSIPFVIAKNNGYFEQEGVDVKIEHFKSAIDRDTALQTGNIDGAISDMLAVVFLNDNGFNVKITSKTDGSFKLVAGKHTNISSLDQVDKNTIGISKNTIIEYLTDRIITNSNAETDNIQKVSIPKIPTRLEMLENGKLDMATLPEPLASVSISSGGKSISSSDDLGINPGVMLFTEDAINSKSNGIKAIYRAYDKAIEYLEEENFENYVDILIEEAGFPQLVKDTLELPDYSKASMPSEKEFIEVLNWLKSKNLTTSNYSFDELINKTLIE